MSESSNLSSTRVMLNKVVFWLFRQKYFRYWTLHRASQGPSSSCSCESPSIDNEESISDVPGASSVASSQSTYSCCASNISLPRNFTLFTASRSHLTANITMAESSSSESDGWETIWSDDDVDIEASRVNNGSLSGEDDHSYFAARNTKRFVAMQPGPRSFSSITNRRPRSV